MREIKLRAWDTENKRFYYFINGGYFRQNGDIAHSWRFIWSNVEQFTGLHDKNGVEIYDGDILTENIFVIFDNGMFKTTHKNDRENGNSLNNTRCRYLEVIGNIHENPELLEDSV